MGGLDPVRRHGVHAAVGQLGQLVCPIVLFVTLSYGAIGFYDDYLKVTKSTVIMSGAACWPRSPWRHRGLGRHARRQRRLSSRPDPVPPSAAAAAGRRVRGARHPGHRRGRTPSIDRRPDGLAIVPVMIAVATFGLIAYGRQRQLRAPPQIHYAGVRASRHHLRALIGAGSASCGSTLPP
jgi:phospho-N-acetylmuramoyl-pentapeptide-transferase